MLFKMKEVTLLISYLFMVAYKKDKYYLDNIFYISHKHFFRNNLKFKIDFCFRLNKVNNHFDLNVNAYRIY